MASVNTNIGAMTALQTLKKTNTSMLETQNKIATGLKVGSAKDAAATWAIASSMRADVATFKAVSENLSLSSSTIATARGAAEKVTDLIKEVKTKVTNAQNGAMDKAKIQADVDGLINQIKSVVDSSSFNGINMLKSANTERILSSIDRSSSGVSASYIEVGSYNLQVSGGSLSSLDNLSVLDRGELLLGDSGDTTTVIAGTGANAAMEGAKQVTFASGGIVAGDVTFTYQDNKGVNQTITVTPGAATNTGIVNALNASSEFKANFYAEVGPNATDVRIMAKDRTTDTKVNAVSMGGAGFAGTVLASASQTGAAMSFNDNQPMKSGEVVQIDYRINSTDHTVKLQVSDAANGTLLGTDADGNKILALNSAVVTKFNVTGAEIADSIRSALTSSELQTGGNNHFAVGAAATHAASIAAAVDGQTIGLSNNGSANLFMNSVDGSDGIRAFTPPVTDYDAVLDKVEKALTTAIDAAASFGSAQKRLDIQKDFISTLTDALTEGIGSLVDADLNEESARLQALQVQQQLGTQALSIANQAPQSILSLFR